ncbi:hypothetical protein KAU33_16210 [Candidatus Dependentiae bacterium]|nr:hypothetical protein [Candidatus Dependentiae bacterium]
MKHADKHLDECEDEECKFCQPIKGRNRCCFGMRDTMGCIMEDPAVQDRCNDLLGIVSRAAEVGANDNVMDLINRRKEKIFNFVFKGHNYTASDSARNQNTCPHCGYRNPSGLMFRRNDPGVVFIGTKDFGGHTAECFECGNCFKKFYYHFVND